MMAILQALRNIEELTPPDGTQFNNVKLDGERQTGSDVRKHCVEGGRWVSTLPVDEGYAWFTLVGR